MSRLKGIAIIVTVLVAGVPPAATAHVEGTPAPAPGATTALFAAGGTQLTNGIFFPGTVLCNGSTCYGKDLALEVPRGNDIQLSNLDADLSAGSHGIICFKTLKRTGRPACVLAPFAGPGQRVMITSHLRPGLYEYTCQVHFGMRGAFEIVGN